MRGAVVRSRALLRHRRAIGCGAASRGIVRTWPKNPGVKVTHAIRHTVLSVRDLLATAGPFIVLAIAAAGRRVLAARPHAAAAPGAGHRQPNAARMPSSARSTPSCWRAKASRSSCATRRAASTTWRCCATRTPASTWRSCRAAPRAPKDNDDSGNEGLMSLGSLFYEPVWLFYREDSARRLLKAAHADAALSQLHGLAHQRRHRGQRRARDGATSCSRPTRSIRAS